MVAKMGMGQGWNESLGLADANNYIVLPYCTGHYIQYPATNHNEKEYENVCMYLYVYN